MKRPSSLATLRRERERLERLLGPVDSPPVAVRPVPPREPLPDDLFTLTTPLMEFATPVEAVPIAMPAAGEPTGGCRDPRKHVAHWHIRPTRAGFACALCLPLTDERDVYACNPDGFGRDLPPISCADQAHHWPRWRYEAHRFAYRCLLCLPEPMREEESL